MSESIKTVEAQVIGASEKMDREKRQELDSVCKREKEADAKGVLLA